MPNLSIKIECLKERTGEKEITVLDCNVSKNEALYVMYNVLSNKVITKDENGKVVNIAISYSIEGKKIGLIKVYALPYNGNGDKFKRLLEIKGKNFYVSLKREIAQLTDGFDKIETTFIME